eukprot:COSAG01_NODE_426_length_17219_cov_9.275637_13_plen_182_part_00
MRLLQLAAIGAALLPPWPALPHAGARSPPPAGVSGHDRHQRRRAQPSGVYSPQQVHLGYTGSSLGAGDATSVVVEWVTSAAPTSISRVSWGLELASVQRLGAAARAAPAAAGEQQQGAANVAIALSSRCGPANALDRRGWRAGSWAWCEQVSAVTSELTGWVHEARMGGLLPGRRYCTPLQ